MTNKPTDTDVEFIQALASILSENDLAEITVTREYGENDRLKVSVSKVGPQAPQAPSFAQTSFSGPAFAAPAPLGGGQGAAPQGGGSGAQGEHAKGGSDDPSAHPGAVTSPMVGTAYLSPEPGTDAFVAIGDSVTEGQTLLIVEAMKTMNHITAPKSGTVRRILIEDGAPVEFGAPLMIVE